ncbi:serine--tRNA ligase [bacterium]|nr:MAG: serine--tRNA ligase [bacterium]RKZ17665.1 MAG: serine--tRNA ligase [bacterium]
MLDRKFVRQEPELVRKAIADKNESADLDRFLELESTRRSRLVEVEELKARRNEASEAIGKAKKAGEDAAAAVEAMREVNAQIKELDAGLATLDEQLVDLESRFPNLPDDDVPRGGEDQNELVSSNGARPDFDFDPLPHWDLAGNLGLMHTAAAAEMSGSGFSLLTGDVARLERALINWFLDVHVQEQGYTEINAPYLVRDAAVFGTGQLPKLADDMYQTTVDQLWLIPTAEVSITNFHREHIFEAGEIPRKYVGFSPCFRREAGSAGKDTRGILRVHQFHKVEMVRFTTPDRSEQELEELVDDATVLLDRLELPWRKLKLASGDLSFAAAKCYDLEVYSAGVDSWLEVSSCSNFRDFQGRRANIRFRSEGKGKPQYVHTLNGSGLALPRVLIAILENYQTSDGTIIVPEVLRPYMGSVRQIG